MALGDTAWRPYRGSGSTAVALGLLAVGALGQDLPTVVDDRWGNRDRRETNTEFGVLGQIIWRCLVMRADCTPDDTQNKLATRSGMLLSVHIGCVSSTTPWMSYPQNVGKTANLCGQFVCCDKRPCDGNQSCPCGKLYLGCRCVLGLVRTRNTGRPYWRVQRNRHIVKQLSSSTPG